MSLKRGSHEPRRGSHDLGKGSHDLGRGSHELRRGSHELGRGSHELRRGSHETDRREKPSINKGKEPIAWEIHVELLEMNDLHPFSLTWRKDSRKS